MTAIGAIIGLLLAIFLIIKKIAQCGGILFIFNDQPEQW